MKTNNNSNGAAGFDLVQPIVEIVEHLLKGLIKLLSWAVPLLVKRILNRPEAAHVIEMKALTSRKQTNHPDALGVDTETRKTVLLKDINFISHSFIVGASGFGKTNLISILQEHSLKNGIPVIFFDPKGDLLALNTFLDLCETHKRTCYVFSEFYKGSVRLNPLLEGTANQVADRIMQAFDWSEQYYKDVAFRSLLRALKDLERAGRDFSLKNIHERLQENPNEKDIVGLLAKLESILESDFSPLLNGTKEDLTISKIWEEGACLYLGLSTQGYGETARSIGKLFLEELLYNSYRSLRGTTGGWASEFRPVSVFFDEFGAVVTPEFIELQNKCRGAGMQLTMAVQTAADIDRIDPALTSQIIENASNIFVMKQRLDAGASLFADAIGTVISKKETYATEDGEKSGRGSTTQSNSYQSHPQLIKNLNVGQCVLLQHSPTRVRLINIRKRKTDYMSFQRNA